MTERKLPTGPILRDADFAAAKLSWRDIESGILAGELERIAPGTYARPRLIDDDTAALASIALRKPEATICLLSALDRHDLTDAIPRDIDLAIPRGSRALRTSHSTIDWHQFDANTFTLGREHIEIADGITMGLYNAERTVVDAFRLQRLIGADIANTALKRWLHMPGSQPASLLSLASHFPHALPHIRAALQVLL
jgi:predicted transcriptional regulator of viral defense system